jgi:hypothetical protein
MSMIHALFILFTTSMPKEHNIEHTHKSVQYSNSTQLEHTVVAHARSRGAAPSTHTAVANNSAYANLAQF